MSGLSVLLRERAGREAAERLARAVTLEALDGVLTFARRERLAARLTDAEAALLAGLAGTGRSAHSLRALAGDLEHLSLWCRAETGAPLPLPPAEALALRFLETQRAADPAPSLATLKRRMVSWAALTRAADAPADVFAAPAVRAALTGRAPVRARARKIGEEELALLLSACEDDGLTGCRDRALLLTAFALNLRPAEIAALTVENLREGTPPQLLLAPQRPVDANSGVFRVMTLPESVFASLSLWRAKAGLSTGPLFRPVDRWGRPGRLGLTPQSVKLIVRARAAAAGLDPSLFSARSLR